MAVDRSDFDALYEREWSGLVAAVTLVCGDPQEAADCVQEAFVRAWQRRKQLDADAGGWLRTTALRVSVSRWRRARNASTAWVRDAARPQRPHDVAEASGVLDVELWTALDRLPQRQREALVLHHVLDLSVVEVARLTGTPTGTIKARLARGRRACADALSRADGMSPAPEGGRA